MYRATVIRSAVLWVSAALALLASTSAPREARADAPVVRPEVMAGDTWTYRRMDYWNNSVAGTRTLRVSAASDKAIQVVSQLGGKELDEIYTPEWNSVSTFAGNFFPEHGVLRFPLRPGDAYKVSFEQRFGANLERRTKNEASARVIGWEQVTVPAGRFRALKIEIDGSFQRIDASISGSIRYVIWYVPEVRRWVKVTFEDVIVTGSPRGPNTRFGEELVEYRLQ